MSRHPLPRRPWSARDDAQLRQLYPHAPTAAVAHGIGRTLSAVNGRAAKLGLRKDAAYLASPDACRLRHGDNVGKAWRYPPGHVPANKGLRRPGYAPGRMRDTQFPKGRPAHEARNYRPIGALRVNSDGYLERKVTDDPSLFPVRRWVGVHRLVWEAARGPIPDGVRVTFKPGTRSTVLTEITIDRLQLLTPAALMQRNTVHRFPQSLVQTVQLLGRVRRHINRKTRAQQDR